MRFLFIIFTRNFKKKAYTTRKKKLRIRYGINSLSIVRYVHFTSFDIFASCRHIRFYSIYSGKLSKFKHFNPVQIYSNKYNGMRIGAFFMCCCEPPSEYVIICNAYVYIVYTTLSIVQSETSSLNIYGGEKKNS